MALIPPLTSARFLSPRQRNSSPPFLLFFPLEQGNPPFFFPSQTRQSPLFFFSSLPPKAIVFLVGGRSLGLFLIGRAEVFPLFSSLRRIELRKTRFLEEGSISFSAIAFFSRLLAFQFADRITRSNSFSEKFSPNLRARPFSSEMNSGPILQASFPSPSNAIFPFDAQAFSPFFYFFPETFRLFKDGPFFSFFYYKKTSLPPSMTVFNLRR